MTNKEYVRALEKASMYIIKACGIFRTLDEQDYLRMHDLAYQLLDEIDTSKNNALDGYRTE